MPAASRATTPARPSKKLIELNHLGPEFEAEHHGVVVALLRRELLRHRPHARSNIALTGHYGSGKSSVLGEVHRKLTWRRWLPLRWRRVTINVSLSSLGADEAQLGRVDSKGAPAPLTNLIQKEIVKQLLYRERPTRMRGSRYRRTDAFHPVRTALGAASLVLVAGVLAVLMGLPGVVNAALVDVPTTWGPSGHARTWAAIGLLALLLTCVLWFLARILHNRVWIEKLSAGPATVSLQDKLNTYFDEYLDEIVYFFQASKTNVVIFEDLDRFNDPHIFEALRELNTVLNNSKQVRGKPVRFVYALRDSIFERIGAPASTLNHPTDETTAAPVGTTTSQSAPRTPAKDELARRKADEDRRVATTNRTKFFDLVVPLIPFATHGNVRQLLRETFADAPEALSDELLELVGPHLTDMRLIKNIHNEYRLFSPVVLAPWDDGLKAPNLLAMIIYKNLHLGDFEALREGRSVLDTFYDDFRTMVDDLSRQAEAHAQDARERIASEAGALQLASERGANLTRVLRGLGEATGRPAPDVVRVNGQPFPVAQISSREFWQLWSAQPSSLTVEGRHGTATWSLDVLTALLGFEVREEDWKVRAAQELQEEERSALALRDWLARASVAQMMARSDLTAPHRGDKTLREIAHDVLGDDLAVALAEAGLLLDENFRLYGAQFRPGALSMSAMNFLMHAVQNDRVDFRYHFAHTDDIDVLARTERVRFLRGKSVFNIEVFNHLLATDPESLDDALDRIAAEDPIGIRLLDSYLESGAHRTALIRRLASRWDRVFDYVATSASGWVLKLLDAALSGARTDVDYDISDVGRETFGRGMEYLDVLKDPDAVGDPAAIAHVLRRFRLQVPRLADLGPGVRWAVVETGGYSMTESNLRAAVDGRSTLQLDVMKRAAPEVYERSLDELDRYLEIMRALGQPVATRLTDWGAVLQDVSLKAPEYVVAVTRASAPGLRFGRLDDSVASQLWPTLADEGAFEASTTNLAAYLAAFGVDDHLRAFLRGSGLSVVVDTTQTETMVLALTLINDAALPADDLARMLQHLKVELDPALITEDGVAALPALVEAGVVRDTTTAFERMGPLPWSAKERYVRTSTEFASHLASVTLTDSDVQHLATSGKVPASVRAAMLEHVDRFAGQLREGSANALVGWAARHSTVLEYWQLRALASGGADPEVVLGALAGRFDELSPDVLLSLVEALGPPYNALLDIGLTVRLPSSPGTTGLVTRLQEFGLVAATSIDYQTHPPALVVNPPGGA